MLRACVLVDTYAPCLEGRFFSAAGVIVQRVVVEVPVMSAAREVSVVDKRLQVKDEVILQVKIAKLGKS